MLRRLFVLPIRFYQRFAICRGVYGTAEDGAGADPVLQLADH